MAMTVLHRSISKWPEAQEDICALEGQGQQHQSVCQGQIKDVNVGSCLHLGVSAERTGKKASFGLRDLAAKGKGPSSWPSQGTTTLTPVKM